MVFIETKRFRITHEAFETETDPGRSFKVLHISDFHFTKGNEKKLAFITSLHKEKPDMVFATGDMIEDDTGIDYCVEALRGFEPPFGTYAVLGSHDYYKCTFKSILSAIAHDKRVGHHENDVEALCKTLKEVGVVLLRNNSVDVKYKDDEGNFRMMQIAGVEDAFIEKDDLESAMKNFQPGTLKILATHCIDSPDGLASRQFDAVFAGHSHGGQVRFPWIGALITRSNLPTKYARGIFKKKKTLFHINNGVGSAKMLDFRLLCPPEATFLEMRGK